MISMIKFIGIILCCFCFATLPAQQPNLFDTLQERIPVMEEETEEEPDIIGDTALYVHLKNISADSLRSWKRDKDLSYVKRLDSVLREKKRQELNKFKDSKESYTPSFFGKLFSSGIFQGLLWILAAVAVGFILYRLFLNKGIFIRDRSIAQVKEVITDDILTGNADYSQLSKQALQQANYRLAVRYLFLGTLQGLSEAGYVVAAPEKTNYQYLQELEVQKRQDFSALILSYEYVWYGRIDISLQQYQTLEKKFSHFQQGIHQR